MNEDAMRYLCELSTHFHLETVEDWDTFFHLLSSINNTGCAYPSVMKNASFPKQTLNNECGVIYGDTDSVQPKPVTHLTVLDVMRFIEDTQNVAIFDTASYSLEYAIYKGDAQNIPHNLIDLKVSKFYSDCSYIETFSGSFIGIRICN